METNNSTNTLLCFLNQQNPKENASVESSVKRGQRLSWIMSRSKKILIPRLIVFHHGIQDGDKLSHAGCDGQLLRFTSFQ